MAPQTGCLKSKTNNRSGYKLADQVKSGGTDDDAGGLVQDDSD
jgi:hypothetical protein